MTWGGLKQAKERGERGDCGGGGVTKEASGKGRVEVRATQGFHALPAYRAERAVLIIMGKAQEVFCSQLDLQNTVCCATSRQRPEGQTSRAYTTP